jgi:AcrR family transcriptional regulator
MPTVTVSSIKKDRIVQAAGKLFARQGYHGTTTREIAHLAEVSENTLFRQFDHKENLFWLALRSQAAGIKFRRDLLEGLAQSESPEVVLPKIVELLTDIVNYRPELLRLIAVAFLELGPKAEAFCREHFSPALSAISHYLEVNIAAGKLRSLDPRMLTAALVTMGLMHPGISRLIDGNTSRISSQEAGRAYAGFWLDLLGPRLSPYAQPIARAEEGFSD